MPQSELLRFGEVADVDDPPAPPAAAAIDRASISRVYGELAPAVHRFLRDLLGDTALAADGTQETFVRAFRGAANAPPGVRIEAWVFGIARNVSLELRKARGRAARVMEFGDAGGASHRVHDRAARSPEAQLLDKEALDVVERALGKLSEDRRAALLLRFDHGLAYEDIAGTMGWSLAKVKVEIFRAREVLRATLEEYRGGSS